MYSQGCNLPLTVSPHDTCRCPSAVSIKAVRLMDKIAYDKIIRRLRGEPDDTAQADGPSPGLEWFTWGVEPFEYREAQKLKSRLLRDYSGLSLEEAIPGEEVVTSSGPCWRITTQNRVEIEVACPELSRHKILSDLKLIYGIGKIKEKQLREAGVNSIADLLNHSRYGSSAALLIELIEREQTGALIDWILRWYPRSHPLSFFVSGFHRGEDFLLLDIETMGLFTRPIILIGVAALQGEDFIINQYLLRDIGEEPAALEAVLRHLATRSAFVTFNGRTFDLPYIQERLFYYGMRADIDRPHFDVLPFSRRCWGECAPNCRLVTLEKFLFGTDRSDDVPSALVPEFYETYMKTGNPGPLIPIVEHNRQDIITLARLFSRLNREWGDG